jgi:hypothetical protein
MTTRTPLVVVGGQTPQMPAGDTVPLAAGGTGATTAGAALTALGAVPSARTLTVAAPLTGGGDLSANRTLAISAASGSAAGRMRSADFTKLGLYPAVSALPAGTVLRVATGATTPAFGAVDLANTNAVTGTLADARLSSNVPLKNTANTFSAAQTINASGLGRLTFGIGGSWVEGDATALVFAAGGKLSGGTWTATHTSAIAFYCINGAYQVYTASGLTVGSSISAWALQFEMKSNGQVFLYNLPATSPGAGGLYVGGDGIVRRG